MQKSSRQSLKDLRRAAGWSRDKAAVTASVSTHLAQLYEVSPDAVRDPEKRRRLDEVYGQFEQLATERRRSVA